VVDLKQVSIQTLVDGPAPHGIASTHDLLEGDVYTEMDIQVTRPEGAWIRTQHDADLDASAAVRGQWVNLFRQWARLDDALHEDAP
jgi:hypothetical protein